jgi:hypothetical protein
VTAPTGRYSMNSQWQAHVEELDMAILTFKQQSLYSYFATWFMKNTLFEKEKIKL